MANYSPINTWDDRQAVGSIKEDIWRIITNIDVQETQLVSGLGTVAVHSVRHEWPVSTLASGATIYKNAEGFTPSYADVTDVTRIANYCQNISAEVKVTDTQRIVDTVGYADRLAEEKSKALKVIKNRMEASLMAGAIATGSSTVARGMAGLKDTTTWNVTNHAVLTTSPSGVSLSETTLNDYLANVWDSTGAKLNEAYMGSALKRRITGFTAGSTLNLDRADKRLVNATDVYESDFGVLKLFLHQYANQGATDNDLVMINSDNVKIGFLAKPMYKTTARVGSYTAGWYETEALCQVNDPRAMHISKRHK